MFKLICINKYGRSRKLDKNSVKETGIEFHLSPLSVIWMNIIYITFENTNIDAQSKIIYTDPSRINS